MRTYGIQIIESQVRLSVDPKGVIAGTATVNTHMDRTLDKARKSVDQFGYMYLSLKRIATYTAIFSFFAKLVQLMGQLIQLELRQAEVSTLVDMRNEQAAASYYKVIGAIGKLPPRLGSMIDLTKGLYEIMSAGVSDPIEAFDLLVTSAKYAKAGITDLATAAATLTSVMKAYGLSADDMRKKSDSMFAAVMEGKFHAEDFNEALGKILPTAAAMGVSIEEVSAVMAVLTQRGLDASQASTAFNRMLISLLKPMDKAKAKLKMLGIDYGINAFRAKSLQEVLEQLSDAQVRYGDILPEIFRRQRGLRAAFIVTGKGLADYIRMLKKLMDAQTGEGEVARAAEKIHNTLSDTLEAERNQLLKTTAVWLKHSGAAKVAVKGAGQLVNAMLRQPGVVVAAGLAHGALSAALVNQSKHVAKTVAAWQVLEQRQLHGKEISWQHYNNLAKEEKMMSRKIKTMQRWRTGLMLAAVAVVLAIEIWRRWSAASKAQTAALDETKKKFQEVQVEAEILVGILKKATGQTEDVAGAVKQLAMEMAKTKMLEMFNMLLKKATERTHNLGVASYEAYAAWSTWLKKLTHSSVIWTTRSREMNVTLERMKEGFLTGKIDLKAFSHIVEMVAKEMGFFDVALADVTSTLEEMGGAGGEAIRDLRREFLFLMRDIPDLKDAMNLHADSIKEMFSEEKLASMIETLGKIQAGFSLELADAFKRAGIDFLDLNITELMARLVKVLKDKRVEDARKTWTEFVRSIGGDLEELAPSVARLEYIVDGVLERFGQFKAAGLSVEKFADEAKSWLVILFDNFGKLTEESKKSIEKFREFVEKGGDTAAKAREKALQGIEGWADEYTNLLRDIAVFENKLGDEQYDDVLRRTLAEVEIKRRQYDEEYLALIDHNALSLEAVTQYTNLMQGLRDKEALAIKVAEVNRILAVRNANKELLGSNYEYNFQKLQAAKRFYAIEVQMITESAVLDKETAAIRLRAAKDFWGKLIESIKLAQSKMEKLVAILKVFGRFFSRMSGSFREMFEALKLDTTFTHSFVAITETLGRAFLNVSGAIEAAEQAMNSWSTEGENFIKKLGKVATVADAVVTVITSLITVIATLFSGKSDIEKAADEAARVARELDNMIYKHQAIYFTLGQMSDSMAKMWAEMRQTGIPGWLAELKLLDRIITDVGINMDNFTYFAEKMAWVLNAVAGGFLESYEAIEIFGKTFKQLIDYAEAHGVAGSKAILDLIRLVKELGFEIPEVTAYIREMLIRGAGGLAKAIAWVGADAVVAFEAIEDLTKEKRKLLREIDRIQERMKKYGMGSEEYEAAQEEVNDLLEAIRKLDKEIRNHQDVLDSVSNATRNSIRDLGIYAAAMFNAMVDSGMPMLDILDEMSEGIFALIDRYKALGMEVPDYLREILKIFRAFKNNPEFFEGLQGLADMFDGLHIGIGLSEDAFRALTREARRYYKLLTRPKSEGGMGFGDEQAIRLMYPVLQKMWWYAEQYGMKLPKWAEEAIQKAKDLGLTFEAPIANQQLDFLRTINEWSELTSKDMESAVGYLATIADAFPASEYQRGSPHIGGSHFAHLHAGEAVVPANLASTLREFFSGRAPAMGLSGEGGGATTLIVNLDGRQLYKGLVPHLREGGAYGDFELVGESVS